MKEVSNRTGSYVFFWLFGSIMIVVSNVAFQQYAIYNLEAERLGQRMDNLGGEYERSLVVESMIEIKNTLVVSHVVMSSQRHVLDVLDHLLALQHGVGSLTREDAAYLHEQTVLLEELMDEVSNLSSAMAESTPDFAGYEASVSAESEMLSNLREKTLEHGRLVWKTGILLIANAFFIILYTLYLSGDPELEEDKIEAKKVSRIKTASALQLIAGVYVVFSNFAGIPDSGMAFYLMLLLLAVSAVLMAGQAGRRIYRNRKETSRLAA